jgi:hypothetical protein
VVTFDIDRQTWDGKQDIELEWDWSDGMGLDGMGLDWMGWDGMMG